MSARAVAVMAIGVWLFLGVACRDSEGGRTPTEPVTPQFDHTNPTEYYQYCRMWNTGVTQLNVGGWWSGPCATTVAATPKVYFANQDTGPITFTFSSTVFDVDFGAYYSSCVVATGMAWTTFDAAGNQLESGSFPGPATCDGLSGMVHVGGMIMGPFKSIRVSPPAPMPPNAPDGRAITFMFDFFTMCPITGDSVTDNLTARKALNREWALARNEGRERGGWILQNETTGDYTVWHDPDTDATRDRCSVNFTPAPPLASFPGHRAVRIWHTHIITSGEPYGPGCRGYPAEGRAPDRPLNAFGPDRAKTEQVGIVPHIIIDPNEILIQYPNSQGGGTIPWPWSDHCRDWTS